MDSDNVTIHGPTVVASTASQLVVVNLTLLLFWTCL
jgi:hypothetical protein